MTCSDVFVSIRKAVSTLEPRCEGDVLVHDLAGNPCASAVDVE
jgi:hypothetical protein